MGADIGLLQPWWLLALPLPLAWLAWRRRRPRPRLTILQPMTLRFPLLRMIKTEDRNADGARSRIAERMFALAMVFAVIALTQPVRFVGNVEVETASEPVDLVLVVGTPISMVLRDYVVDGERVDRMTLTRRLLDRFVDNFQGRRIGLVVLGRPPALWLPLTSDKTVVRDAIERLRTTMLSRVSDTGAALQLVNDGFGDTADKVVVLVTDGSLQLGAISPNAAARTLAAGGNTLYVIGIGASDPADYGGDVGGLIYEPIDPAALSEVAAAGGGRFFHARDVGGFEAALTVIESAHRKPVMPSPAQRVVQPWYPVPLGAAMLLLLTASLKRRTVRTQTGEPGA
ncbi:MAG: VWA domain-containing protein [Chromatiaceae bacterium]|nr:VWA domain-containing protein [Gammaproteobacteria bacterium]MCP5316260.1 VWA domain-containing protein [Chromatiaceae bacterium]